MDLKKIFAQLNIINQCRRYGLPLWQCPSILFLIMGIIIIASLLVSYALGARYVESLEIVALIVLLLAVILFIIAFIIIHSFEKLAEVNRMKSEFVKIVTHQLRAPLANLNLAVDILVSDNLKKTKENQSEYFRILKENSSRMANLVKDLLVVSKTEENFLITKQENVSLEEIIKKIIARFKPFALASNIGIKFEAQSNLPKVFIDPSQMEIVIENLLDNAIRYGKEKGEVNIALEKRKENLYFEIKDNGSGILKEDQKYIFQKFFRSENAIKQQTLGSGLGLFIAKSIIEKSRGKIGFKSQEEIGSTFWFTLPIK